MVKRYSIFIIILFTLFSAFPASSDKLIVRVGHYENHPKLFTNKNGQISGIFPDILKVIAEEENWKLEFISGTWEECLSRLENGDIDIMPDVAYSEQRNKIFDFSDETIFVNWAMVYANSSIEINSIIDINNKRIAVMKGSIHTDGSGGIKSIISQFDLSADVIEVNDYDEVFSMISSGSADAGVVNRLFGSMNEKKYSVNPTTLFFNPSNLKFAFNKSRKDLIKIVDNRITLMKAERNSRFYDTINRYLQSDNYFDVSYGEKPIFSDKERIWLSENRTFKIGINKKWPPIEFVTGNKYGGVISDIISFAGKTLDADIIPDFSTDWEDVINELEEGRIDFISAIVRTSQRSARVLFTEPYMTFPIVIVTRKNFKFINHISDLKDYSIACVSGDITEYFLKRDYPYMRVEYFNSPIDALTAVSKGRADAVLETISVLNYVERKHGIRNLLVAATTPYVFELSMAVRKDNVMLLGILNKTLRGITANEKYLIADKWINPVYENYTDLTRLFIIFSVVIVIFSIIYLIILYSNKRLEKEILEKNQIQRELIKSKEAADAANRAKSEFLANMSHEIRTPMNAILGFTEILTRKEKEPKLQSYLKSIYSSGQSLLEIINNVLDLSKVEAGKMEVKPVPASIKDMIDEVYKMYTALVNKKGLKFEIFVNEDFPEMLLVDINKLRQIVVNLIGNAVKFTEEGFIRISLDYRENLIDDVKTYDVVISVEDSGIGIPEEHQKKLFEKFSQLHKESASIGGTGLGLAISKQLALLMGADITFKSRYGKGSIFYLSLKNTEVPAVCAIDEYKIFNPDDIVFKKALILIVDDIQLNRDMLVGMLEDYNFKLMSAANGKECVDMVKLEKPDLILLDMKMPVMSGEEVLIFLKGNSEYSNIPVIAITASILKEDEEHAKERCDDYLKKPVNKTTLIHSLMKYLPYDKVESVKQEGVVSSYYEVLAKLTADEDVLKFIRERHDYINNLLTGMAINEIISFSEILNARARSLNNINLIVVSEILKNLAGNFDIDEIKNILREFLKF